MNVTPVVERELRAAARQPVTYALRSLSLAAVLVVSVVFGANYGFGANLGGKLFGSLHLTLFCAIWILVPLLTADCISRERREGTLGLLFLTGLTGADIVTAKSLAHGLRAVGLWLAVLPALTVPFLLGGVSWQEAVLSALINLSAICWALAAGLLSSAWSKARVRALIGAVMWEVVFLAVLAFATGTGVFLTYGSAMRTSAWQVTPENAFSSGLVVLAFPGGDVNNPFRLALASFGLRAIGAVTLMSVIGLLFIVRLAGARTRRSWREEPPSHRRLWLERTFCTPVFWVSFFRSWKRRKLEQNPIGWLEQRTWSGRLVTWGWFAVVISLYSAASSDRRFMASYSAMQSLMGWLLAGSLAMSAAGSFRRERETGVLELLLVSPLDESSIMWGRLRGLWGQFLPAFVLFVGVWLYFASLFPYGGSARGIAFCCLSFLTLPAIGLYYSLRCRNSITAFLSTLVAGFFVPLILPDLLWFMWFAYSESLNFPVWRLRAGGGAAFWQIVIAVLCWDGLHRRLTRRTFALELAGH